MAERIISDGRLLSKSLNADVERITREKQVAQERAETTKVRLSVACSPDGPPLPAAALSAWRNCAGASPPYTAATEPILRMLSFLAYSTAPVALMPEMIAW